MSIEKKCGCIKHDELTKDVSKSTLKKLQNRPFKKSVIMSLIDKCLLDKRATYLCTVCANYSEQYLVECTTSETAPPVKKIKLNAIETVIESINSRDIDHSDLINLTRAIGKSQANSFSREASEATKSYSENLETFEINYWLSGRNIILLTFLKSIIGLDGDQDDHSKFMALAASIDCLLSAVNKCAISPLFFALNLTFFFICGSKTICSLLSAISPSGCYSTVCNWFAKQSNTPVECPGDKDIITYFDNNQVLARNWRVRYDAKAMLSVITTVIHIVPAKFSTLQYQAELCPSSWLYIPVIPSEGVVSKIMTFIDTCNERFKQFRDSFIQERIQSVYSEQTEQSNIIDELLNDPDMEIQKGITSEDPYGHIKHNHPRASPKAVLGDPCMKNPCSYSSVKFVLEQLSASCGVGNQRKWTAIGGDGLPYLLGSRLIEQNEQLQNILLQPGLGHYEINMAKACFKLLWDVALCDLAKLLGFKSIKAQTACQNANDHHKSLQILEIFLYGTADEMIIPYVRDCIESSTCPSLHGFYSWLSLVEDPNYLFLKDAVFTYVLSLFVFRSGIRRNNSEAILTARTKFCSLFYGFNCTCYQEIDYRDLRLRLLAPDVVKEFLSNNESFTVSGHPSKGEGADFLLENKNRRIKMLIPSGVPTENRWTKVCRSFDKLDAIRSNVTKMTHLSHLSSAYDRQKDYHTDLRKETLHWRRKLRESKYLSSPLEKKVHTSLSQIPLDEELVNFSQHCKGNRELYLEDIKNGCLPGKGDRLLPVFIKKEDRDKYRNIRNKTKDEIKRLILDAIADIKSVGCDEEGEHLSNTFNKTIKVQTKDSYITFYRTEVCVVLDDALSRLTTLDDEDEEEVLDC